MVGVVVAGVIVRVLVVVRVAMLMFAIAMMVVLVRMSLARVLAIEPRHIMVVVLELGGKLNVKVAGVDAVLVHARHGNLKDVDRQGGKLLAQVFFAGPQIEQGRDGHIAADARGSVDDECFVGIGHGCSLVRGR